MKLQSAVRFNIIFSPIVFITTAISSVLVIRFLEPQIYSEYAVLMSLLAIFTLISDFGCNIGISRYLKVAKDYQARSSLYKNLQFRRWLFGSMIVFILILCHPSYLDNTLPKSWKSIDFIFIGLLGLFTLHAQLATSYIINSFRHKYAMSISTSISFIRALVLIFVAYFFKSSIFLLYVLIPMALIEAILLEIISKKIAPSENKSLKVISLNKVQYHGFIALFDKFSTYLTNGPFLIIFFAAFFNKYELAVLAVCCELVQKIMSIVCMPLTNIIYPTLNNASSKKTYLYKQISIINELGLLIFLIPGSLIAGFFLFGLPLILGNNYSDISLISIIWLCSVFIEGYSRAVWGASLITLRRYKWLNIYNSLYLLLSLGLLFTFNENLSLLQLVSTIAVFKFFMATIINFKAINIFKQNKVYLLKIILITLIGFLCSIFVQNYLVHHQISTWIAIIIGLLIHLMIIFMSFRFIPIVSELTYSSLCKLCGQYQYILKFFIPQFDKNFFK